MGCVALEAVPGVLQWSKQVWAAAAGEGHPWVPGGLGAAGLGLAVPAKEHEG